MKLQYDIKKRSFSGSTALLKKHDIVFRAPVCDPTYGLPIGDGDTGCLLWLSPDALNININKTDLWDDSTSDDGVSCPTDEENITVNRHGASISLNFGCPVFECIFSKNFEARLSISDATAFIHSETPFCTADITAYASHAASVTVIEADVSFADAVPVSLTMQRWGSRTFWYWYSRYKNVPDRGLDGTMSGFDENDIYITQHLNGTDFCVMMRALHSGQINKTAGIHAVRGELEPQNSFKLKYILTLATGLSTEEARKNAAAHLDKAASEYTSLYEEHCREWSGFWSKSFVALPEKQDYIENLWYLNLYYANCEMRGKYPAHFCNGVWNFYYDFVPWNYFFHYNMQLSTFPLDTCNHPELLETYYNFRHKQFPNAKKFSREVMGKSGAFYADVCDREGKNEAGTKHNCTCAAQIAVAMYRHFLYTGDEGFLREKAIPVMLGAAEFYLDILTQGDDGFYHIHGTQGYEGSPLLDDSITDLEMIRCLFSILSDSDFLPDSERAVYRTRLDKLTPYVTLPMDDDEVSDGTFIRGIGKGKKAYGNRVLSVGKKCGGDYIRKTHGNPAHDYYGFPDTEMAVIFPSGNVGIRDIGSEIYGLAYNSVCLHHPAVPPDTNSDGICMGWCMEPIYLARMGMARELAVQLEQSVSTWIIFPQGFGIYGPHDVFSGDNRLRWKKNYVTDTDTGEKSAAPAWNFRHFDYETLPIIAAAVNEMLLQSHDGTVRLFPAIESDAHVRFRLAASGGFIVNAEYHNGEFDVYIECTRDGEIRLALAEFCAVPVFTDADTGKVVKADTSGGAYVFSLHRGECLRAASPNADKINRDCNFYLNNGMKTLGGSQLGEEKFF